MEAEVLRLRGVVHGSVNHQGALSRKTPDGRYCNGVSLSSEWAGDVFYGKGAGDRSGLQNLGRTSSLVSNLPESNPKGPKGPSLDSVDTILTMAS
jgi:hypothetical protein